MKRLELKNIKFSANGARYCVNLIENYLVPR
jgi:hypothetical protein